MEEQNMQNKNNQPSIISLDATDDGIIIPEKSKKFLWIIALIIIIVLISVAVTYFFIYYPGAKYEPNFTQQINDNSKLTEANVIVEDKDKTIEYEISIEYANDDLKHTAEKYPEYLSAIKKYINNNYDQTKLDDKPITLRFNTYIQISGQSVRAVRIDVYSNNRHYVLDNWGSGATFENAIQDYLINNPQIFEQKLITQLQMNDIKINHSMNFFSFEYAGESYNFYLKTPVFSQLNLPSKNIDFIFSESLPAIESLDNQTITGLAQAADKVLNIINDLNAEAHVFYFNEDRAFAKTIIRTTDKEADTNSDNPIKISIDLLNNNIYYDNKDEDKDGLSDFEELEYGTDYNSADSDNDGFSDKDELSKWFNPNGAGELIKINNILVVDNAPYITCYRNEQNEKIAVDCPTIMQIRDPMGFPQSRIMATILGASAEEADINGDGGKDQYIEIPFPEYGKYIITLYFDNEDGAIDSFNDVMFDVVGNRKDQKLVLGSGKINSLPNYNFPVYIIGSEL